MTKLGQLHPCAAELSGDLAHDGYRISILENHYDQGKYTDKHELVIHCGDSA
ncbi:hypothetical protein [Cerasicoccus arenae]|uniref:hypothetical protein n=1 Tax=Cerasicoccus arenae TaxID=424488 RepID=UPI001677C759|nr:hypothetical protein [Cerasicoccus arenae]MBK1856990.1 hypothetical protein [Cerasicoccus arenae]